MRQEETYYSVYPLNILNSYLVSGYLRVVFVQRYRRKMQLIRQLCLTTRIIITSRVRNVSSFPPKVCDARCLIQVFLQQKRKLLYVILLIINSGFSN